MITQLPTWFTSLPVDAKIGVATIAVSLISIVCGALAGGSFQAEARQG